MEAHELAKKLLELPDETVFIKTDKGSFHIKDVKLCSCEAEIFITLKDF
jgi:hypothetical protein